MGRGYIADEKVDASKATVLASKTNQVVSEEFHITPQGAMFLRVDIVSKSTVVGAGITFNVQFWQGDGNWATTSKSSVSVTGDGVFTIFFNSTNDTADIFPLSNKARVVVTTGVGSSVVISHVYVMQG